MYKCTIQIDGMACGMCEAHVNSAVRKVINAKKVTSSHKKGTTEIIAQVIDEVALKKAIEETGYRVLSIKTENYVKKGLFSF
ncbi:MAG: cation transporter [Clostridia bacterium]|nr:cation transporter [Clostridia bacterium]